LRRKHFVASDRIALRPVIQRLSLLCDPGGSMQWIVFCHE
jgi:hypothetical protein